MKYRWICSNKSIIKFVISLAIIGVIIGIIFFSIQSNDTKNESINTLSNIINNLNISKLDNIYYHLGLISILIIFSFILIGLPLTLFYYFYEFVSLGYLLSLLYKYKSISGILYGTIFIIVNKLVFLTSLAYFIIHTINYTKGFIKNFKSSKKELIHYQLIKSIIIVFMITINDIILYFIGSKIMSICSGLIK